MEKKVKKTHETWVEVLQKSPLFFPFNKIYMKTEIIELSATLSLLLSFFVGISSPINSTSLRVPTEKQFVIDGKSTEAHTQKRISQSHTKKRKNKWINNKIKRLKTRIRMEVIKSQKKQKQKIPANETAGRS